MKAEQIVADGKDLGLEILQYLKRYTCMETPSDLRAYNFDCNKRIVCDSALTQEINDEKSIDQIID